MAKYNDWSVVFNEQPSETKWNILGDNDSYHEEVVTDGWVEEAGTLNYASADDPTFTATISGDKTGKYGPGTRIRLKQSGGYKYFIVTAASYSAPNTTLTLYGGTDYDLANAGITDVWFSQMKSPIGFPLDPAKWTVTLTDTTQRSQSSPVANTWYNAGSLSISIPIGVWDITFTATPWSSKTSATSVNCFVTLSTANNSQSDSEFTGSVKADGATGTMEIFVTNTKRKTLTLTVKTTYYVNIMTSVASTGTILLANATVPLKVTAVCAYL